MYMIRNMYSIIGYTEQSKNDKDQNTWRIYLSIYLFIFIFLLNEIRHSDNTQAFAV